MTAVPVTIIVLGVDSPIGLTLVRECGVHGLRVIALGGSAEAPGGNSRFATVTYRREQERGALVQQLIDIARRHNAQALLTVSESDIDLLNDARTELEPHLKLLIPTRATMARVVNKDECIAVARDLGIATPRTLQVHSPDEIDRAEPSLRFPVVLKWANPHAVAPTLVARNLALKKVEYAMDRDELHAILSRYDSVDTYPLIQEYCAGYGMGQMFLMRGGEPILTFQHRRVHEYPPEGGVSSLCESVSADLHGECRDRSIALLRALAWDGPAMVEYRHNPETGQSVLMEVNGRFWGSQPLAFHAGAHFAWLSVASALGLPTPSGAPYRVGLRCRYMVPETYRLARILFQPREIALKSLRFSRLRELVGFLFGFVDPRMSYYVYWHRDPRPFFVDAVSILRKAASRFTARKA